MDERASVGLLGSGEESGGGGEGEGVVLERGVGVECGAVVEARVVGGGTVVEVGARVGRGAVVGKVSFGGNDWRETKSRNDFFLGFFCFFNPAVGSHGSSSLSFLVDNFSFILSIPHPHF